MWWDKKPKESDMEVIGIPPKPLDCQEYSLMQGCKNKHAMQGRHMICPTCGENIKECVGLVKYTFEWRDPFFSHIRSSGWQPKVVSREFHRWYKKPIQKMDD